MANGAEARKRTDRGTEFTDSQRIWLLERDLDDVVREWSKELGEMRTTLRRISGACIGILTALVGALVLLVLQLGGGR